MNVLIVGNDRFLLKQQAKKWLETQAPFAKDVEPVVMDGSSTDFKWDEVFEEILTISFFSDIKVIELMHPPGFANKSTMSEAQLKQWTHMIEQLPKEVILIVMVEANKIDQRLKIVKPLLVKGKLIQVSGLSPNEFRKFVQRQCDLRNMSMDSATFEQLMYRLPKQMTPCLNELDKLANYPHKLDQKTMSLLLSVPLEENVFELSKAIVSKNLKKALHIYGDLQTLKHDPVALIPSIAWQLRLMFQVLLLQRERLSSFEIRERLNENDFVLSKAIEYAKGSSVERIVDLLEHLASLDQQIKSGKVDKKFGFELFMIEATR